MDKVFRVKSNGFDYFIHSWQIAFVLTDANNPTLVDIFTSASNTIRLLNDEAERFFAEYSEWIATV